MKRWRNLLLGAFFSGFFLWLALRGLDWRSVGITLRNTQWGFVLLAMGMWSLGLAARAMRWRFLLGGRVALGPTFHVLNVGFLLNNTLPFRIGELARAYLVGRSEYGVTGWAALSTIVTERILDMLIVVLMLAAVLPVLAVDPAVITGGALLGGTALLGFSVLLLLAHRPQWGHAVLRQVLRIAPPLARLQPATLLERLLDGLHPLTTRRGLLGAATWTAVAWACSVVGSWILAGAFPGLTQTPIMRAALTLSVVAASFSIIIPFTLASVGPFEAAAVFALMTAGVPRSTAATYALVWHAGVVLVYGLWGVIGMLALGLSPGQLRHGAAALESGTPADASD